MKSKIPSSQILVEKQDTDSQSTISSDESDFDSVVDPMEKSDAIYEAGTETVSSETSYSSTIDNNDRSVNCAFIFSCKSAIDYLPW